MKIIIYLLLFIVASFTPQSISRDITLGGLVLDRTVTRFGKDFVFYYSGYWRDIPATDNITVVIYEQVYPQAGTVLWVEMNDRRIYQTYFGRRYNDVKETAEQAVLQSLTELARIQADRILGESAEELF
ncbi:curli production assembly/transport protein CsgE [Alkalimonas sp.]|uniref:curli production assembly/transport protein CsgE n=1 Tax=Alkalimonas sp. TaxID=1872453 RepID=UPI00263A8776|nr:curli production assembly/transport protein CsgE [Alkalimonas sp.]MCC5825246.1 curli production assembly/transport protein CsgE [Alkalimonas sp.]